MKSKALSFVFAVLALPLPGLWAAPEALEIHHGIVGQLPGGREADGIVGDFVLRSDKIEATIAQNAPLRRANMGTFFGNGGETPGCLYDLTLRGENNDQLTVFSPCNQRGEISWVRIVPDSEPGEAAVEVFASAAKRGGISVRHEYRLREGISGLFITTTFTNETEAAANQDVRDVWTRFENQGIQGRYHWADSVDPSDLCGYAFAWLEPEESTVKDGQVTIEPGATFTIRRFLAVGNSPAEAVGLLAGQLDEAGSISVLVTDESGQPVDDAVLYLELGSKTRIPAYPRFDGSLGIPFVKGNYTASIGAPGRPSITVPVESGRAPQPVVAKLAAPSSIDFEVTDAEGLAIPSKVQFQGIDGTANPDLGPTIRAHGCADQWHSETSRFSVKIPAGTYRIAITHGPEYGHFEEAVKVGQGETATVIARLPREVDSTGWISADFHNHSTPSGDNVCGTDDRVINLAAEGIEFAPTTEHNRIYDWTPHIEKLYLSEFISTIPGIELTGRGAHINSFPLKPVPKTQDGGAPVWENDPRINMNHLRNLDGWHPERWIQINHPDLSENFIDRDKNGAPDGGFSQLEAFCDAVETQNYRTSNILQPAPFRVLDPLAKGSRIETFREFVWLQLLNQGTKVWGVAVNDAHTVYGNGVGSWRTYLPSTTDEPAKIDWKAVVQHARAGHMILSSGPFLSLEVGEGALPGETICAKDNVDVGIRVQCADWYAIDRVQILVNGRQEPELNFTRESHPDWFGDGIVQFDRKVEVKLTEDSHLIVVAIGENSTLEKGFGTSAQRTIHPCAYNNPIFVDIDGNGFQPNGDTLGYPLPVGGLSVDEAKKILGEK